MYSIGEGLKFAYENMGKVLMDAVNRSIRAPRDHSGSEWSITKRPQEEVKCEIC